MVFVSLVGVEPTVSLFLRERGLPVAYKDKKGVVYFSSNSCVVCPRWESNPQTPHFECGPYADSGTGAKKGSWCLFPLLGSGGLTPLAPTLSIHACVGGV